MLLLKDLRALLAPNLRDESPQPTTNYWYPYAFHCWRFTTSFNCWQQIFSKFTRETKKYQFPIAERIYQQSLFQKSHWNQIWIEREFVKGYFGVFSNWHLVKPTNARISLNHGSLYTWSADEISDNLLLAV